VQEKSEAGQTKSEKIL